jgi:hypothetical protein
VSRHSEKEMCQMGGSQTGFCDIGDFSFLSSKMKGCGPQILYNHIRMIVPEIPSNTFYIVKGSMVVIRFDYLVIKVKEKGGMNRVLIDSVKPMVNKRAYLKS